MWRGPELDGCTTLRDLGLEGFASSKKPFVGSVLRRRPVLEDAARPTLVGLVIRGEEGAKACALLFPQEGEAKGHGDGWVSSTTFSPALVKNLVLGFLKNGTARHGERIRVEDFVGNQSLTAEVVSPYFLIQRGSGRMVDALSAHAGQKMRGTQADAVTLRTRPLNGLWQIAGWDDFQAAAQPVLERLSLPDLGSHSAAQIKNGVTVWRTAPDKLWIEGATDLSCYAGDNLAVRDLSHARTVIVVSGPAARDLLSCLVSVDTSPKSLTPREFRQTGLHGVGVLVHCTAKNDFDILVPSSRAGAVMDILSINAHALGSRR